MKLKSLIGFSAGLLLADAGLAIQEEECDSRDPKYNPDSEVTVSGVVISKDESELSR